MSELDQRLWAVVEAYYYEPPYRFLSTELYLKFGTPVYGEHVEQMWGLD